MQKPRPKEALAPRQQRSSRENRGSNKGASAPFVIPGGENALKQAQNSAQIAVETPAVVTSAPPTSPWTSGSEGLPAGPEAVSSPSGAAARGVMEIVLAAGCRVIVDKDVNGAALARVIAVLAGR
jgi:hypothetical protein